MLTKEEARRKVGKIVEKFLAIPKKELDGMPEEQIKFRFIEPLFEILGWEREDIEKEKRVLKGRADYILRIGNQNKLVIEAKKTSVGLNEEEGRQAVSYAYHKNIKFAILTNFARIRVYHALSNIKNIDKNLLKDKTDYLRFNCEDFVKDFERLWLLSKESFEKEEINKLLQNVDKRLIKPIDKSILTDLLQFREWLSKDLKSKRMQLEDSQIDEIVQILIDRLIFMRSVEDRGLEGKDFLLTIIDSVQKRTTDKNLWALLKDQFKRFDNTYNSKLFAEGLLEKEGAFADNILIKTINGLYYGTQHHQERYMFDEIPVDLLGSIYEQYLGTILRGTEKRVKLDLVSGKRKKMGIYYTPSYIVDYIVKNTIGEYCNNKSLDEVLNIKIVDPACGSGSFLIRAFQELINIAEERLKKGEKSKKYKHAFQDLKEKLTLGEKATILKNCIYGVDLDEKAVELAQLNLLLKILEEETRETKNKRLPNLLKNIRNGNSLISDSGYDKAFNWKAQFPEVFQNGGFEVVVGNPPYVNAISLTRTLGKEVKNYWKNKYFSAKGTYDIYILFFEQSFNICKEGGFVSFITPNKWLSAPYGIALRELILKNYKLIRILDLSRVQVFSDPSVYPIISIIKKSKSTKEYSIVSEKIFSEDLNDKKEYNVSSKNLDVLPKYIWGAILSDKISILQKIFNKSKPLEEVSIVRATSTASEADEYSKYINSKNKGIPIINTGTIDRYATTYGIKKFRNKGEGLQKPFLDISKISDMRKKLYQTPKIIVAKLALFIEGFIDVKGGYASINTNCIHSPKMDLSLKSLAGIINSKLISFVYSEIFSGLKMSGGYFQFQAPQLRVLPIKLPTSKSQEQKIIGLVEQMLELQKKIHSEGISGNEKEQLEQQIKNVDYEIDEEVYRLYGLTKDEIKVVEGSLG